jgi:hypothetical protein
MSAFGPKPDPFSFSHAFLPSIGLNDFQCAKSNRLGES